MSSFGVIVPRTDADPIDAGIGDHGLPVPDRAERVHEGAVVADRAAEVAAGDTGDEHPVGTVFAQGV